MWDDPQNAIVLFASVMAFGLVLSLWLMGVVLWTSHRRKQAMELAQRLDFAKSASSQATGGRVLRLWHDGKEATTIVPGLSHHGLLATLERFRIDAGWETPALTAIPIIALFLLAAAIGVFMITASTVVAIMTIPAGIALIWLVMSRQIAKRAETFERQLIDALELAARSLRVGHPLIGSFRLIAEEIPAPVGNLFGEVCQQQALGMSMEQALRGIAGEYASEDLKLFSTSVVIQLTSGGNLADMMDRLANVIRERQRLARRVRVLTAQTQFSKRVLLSLPFFVFFALNLINPNYMKPLYGTVIGQIIMLVASILMLLGWMAMNWLSKLVF